MIAMPRHDLLTTIRKLGLSANLQLCLDAGHETSLPAASSKWIDLSGNGYDFFLGTTSGADATDPTINGTAGRRSSGEYLSCDGGDYLLYDSANETWMENIHKANGILSVAAWVYLAATAGNQGLCGTRGSTAGNGFVMQIVSSNNIQFQIRNSGTVAFQTNSTGGPLVDGQWNFIAFSYDETLTDSTEARWFINGSESTINTNSGGALSASAASYAFEIGALGNAQTPLENTNRLAQFAAWTRVLDPDQFQALFQATRGKFGV